MNATVKAAIITALKADGALTTLLGGSYVYPGHVAATQRIPGVYVTGSDSSSTLPGYATTKHRENRAELVANVFHNTTALAADTLADAVEASLLSAPPASTRGWSLASKTEQFEEDTRLHHRTLRFSFEYSLQD